MRRTGARHRATYVVVRTSSGGVVVHRRADWKDICPGAWDLCFGGVVDAGEDWDEAAARELAEEAGISGSLQLLGTDRFDAPGIEINCRIYEVEHDGPYPCPDGEVVEVRVVAVGELDAFVATHDVCPDSVAVVLPHLAP
jgi:8-oxo-dGTP pyrophosphatase MutT (NUDIX family)